MTALGPERAAEEEALRQNVRWALDEVLDGKPVDTVRIIDRRPRDPADVMNALDVDPYEPDERVLIAGQVHGWYIAERLVDGERFCDVGWEDYLRGLVVECADCEHIRDENPIDENGVDLTDVQTERLGVSLALLQRGITIGLSEALKSEDLEDVDKPKSPKQRAGRNLGKAGVVLAGVFGLISPISAFPTVVVGGMGGGGAKLAEAGLLAERDRAKTAKQKREESSVSLRNKGKAYLREQRDKPPRSLLVVGIEQTHYMKDGLDNYTSTVQSINRAIAKMQPTFPKLEEAKADKQERQKGLVKTTVGTTACAALAAASGLLVQGIAEDDSARVRPPSMSSTRGPGQAPVSTMAPLSQSPMEACSRIQNDQDGNPSTPNTVRERQSNGDERIRTCPPSR